MVISHKMILSIIFVSFFSKKETKTKGEIGNRGSKSVT